jgi:hypothetical protein
MKMNTTNPVIGVLKVLAYILIPILTVVAMHYWNFDANVGYPIIAASLGLLGVNYTPVGQIVGSAVVQPTPIGTTVSTPVATSNVGKSPVNTSMSQPAPYPIDNAGNKTA